MKIHEKVMFPCGYQYELTISSFGGSYDSDSSQLPVCPIHGTKCKEE